MSKTVIGSVLDGIEGDLQYKVGMLIAHFIQGYDIKNLNTGEVVFKIPAQQFALPHYLVTKKYITEYVEAAQSALNNFTNVTAVAERAVMSSPVVLTNLAKVVVEPSQILAMKQYAYAIQQLSVHLRLTALNVSKALKVEGATEQMLNLALKIDTESVELHQKTMSSCKIVKTTIHNLNDDGTFTQEFLNACKEETHSDLGKEEEGSILSADDGGVDTADLQGSGDWVLVGEDGTADSMT